MKYCTKCVLPETYPGIHFDTHGVCNFCNDYGKRETGESVNQHFQNENELIQSLQRYKGRGGKYDVLVPLSGGVDSSVALIHIVEKYHLRALGFHNDHGYEDETATNNVRKLCAAMDVDLLVWQHDFKFMKKLWKCLNESNIRGLSGCYLCGNILYLNALELADRFGIQLIINGYSKGQAAIIQNTEKGKELLEGIIEIVTHTGDREFVHEFMRKYDLLQKQKIFQTRQDLELLYPDKIMVIPFYLFQFYKTDKEALQKICSDRFNWQPMKTTYPRRTTNCEMIWLNTFMDLQKMGYSVYHDEYSSLVRAGEITREQAFNDLEFLPSPTLIERLAAEIGMNLKEQKHQKQSFTRKMEGSDVSFDL